VIRLGGDLIFHGNPEGIEGGGGGLEQDRVPGHLAPRYIEYRIYAKYKDDI
jgi:hypothetical protein